MNFASWEPPFSGSESEHLIGMLNRLRATFRWKADGLTVEQLGQPIPSSQLTIGGLLRHLSICEDDIFAGKIGGERLRRGSGPLAEAVGRDHVAGTPGLPRLAVLR